MTLRPIGPSCVCLRCISLPRARRRGGPAARQSLGPQARRADRRPALAGGGSAASPAGRMAARRASRSGAGATFPRCRAEADGLREVYFEYDDELEYIARARDSPARSRAGPAPPSGFPIVVSALFDDRRHFAGHPHRDRRAARASQRTLPRPICASAPTPISSAASWRRASTSCPRSDCPTLAAGEGEKRVGAAFVKQSCEKTDPPGAGARSFCALILYRKPGQSGTNPQLPTQLTEGQFESSARLEMYHLGEP